MPHGRDRHHQRLDSRVSLPALSHGGASTWTCYARTRVPRLYAAGNAPIPAFTAKTGWPAIPLLEALVFGRRAAGYFRPAEIRAGAFGARSPKESLAGKPLHHGYRTKIRRSCRRLTLSFKARGLCRGPELDQRNTPGAGNRRLCREPGFCGSQKRRSMRENYFKRGFTGK